MPHLTIKKALNGVTFRLFASFRGGSWRFCVTSVIAAALVSTNQWKNIGA